MRIAAMQPYFLPYIGYWQLLDAVDVFVILDDVNFINRGYINRNSILLNNQAHRFSLSLDRASQNRLIMDIDLNFPPLERDKFLKTIQTAYRRAPRFEQVYPLVEDILLSDRNKIARYIEYSLGKICAFAGMAPRIVFSSEVEKDGDTKGQERILELCRVLGADMYVNPPGGRALYDGEEFRKRGVELRFMQPCPSEYKQFGAPFVPNLSFLDVMMFNDTDSLRRLLKEYTLENPD